MEDDPDLAALLEQKRLLEAQLKHDLQFEFGQPDSHQFPPTEPPLCDDSRKRRANADSQASSLASTPDRKRHRRMAVDFGDDDGQLGTSAITSTPGSELSESPIRTPTRLSDHSGHSDSLLLSELVGGCPHGAVDLHRSLERLTDTSIEEKDLTPTPSKARMYIIKKLGVQTGAWFTKHCNINQYYMFCVARSGPRISFALCTVVFRPVWSPSFRL
jgi:hypothetical protein